MTLTELEFLVTESLDIPCERPRRDMRGAIFCQPINPAEWILHTWCPNGCDSHPRLYCTHCKDKLLLTTALHCDECQFNFRPGSSAYTLIEPLR